MTPNCPSYIKISVCTPLAPIQTPLWHKRGGVNVPFRKKGRQIKSKFIGSVHSLADGKAGGSKIIVFLAPNSEVKCQAITQINKNQETS